MKKRIKSRTIGILLCGLAATAALILTLTGVKVIPGSVSYTVKEASISDSENKIQTAAEKKRVGAQRPYTVRTVDDKICVILDGAVVHEIDVNIASLTEYDRQRLANGITVYDDNELLCLTEYLKS